MSEAAYRVLARKYRPTRFEELIGQETLVRTLTNALASGRIAHAFMLTGVRGVGKTTTARLIARALNCEQGPTITPCGMCDACVAIAADRHPDVIEMDAASRTGVDDVRELIEQVRYRPVSARYKVYIIDEVHMLSKPAFNALLKTLEEPPPDIKFVFATTEINKVPVTVLSRCQRYTLPRIPADILAAYYGEIAVKEAAKVDPEALALIARAADGSVRDGLSILDQAIALAFGETVTALATRQMLGLADRAATFDLFEAVMRGDAAAALDRLDGLYRDGAEPSLVVQDLLDLTHFVTRLKLEAGAKPADRAAAAAAPVADGHDRTRGLALAQKIGMAALARTWQMLLKGLGETLSAPQPLQAAEMVLIRLAYVTDLPPPAEIVRSLSASASPNGPAPSGPAPSGPAPNGPSTNGQSPVPRGDAAGRTGNGPVASAAPAVATQQIRTMPTGNGATAAARQPEPEASLEPAPQPPALQTFEAVLELVGERREAVLYNQLAEFVHPVRLEPGLFEFRPEPAAPRELAGRLAAFLLAETGQRWLMSVSSQPGAPTFREAEAARHAAELLAVRADPMVQAVLASFPGAWIRRIDERMVRAEAAAPLPETEPEPEPPENDPDDPGPSADGAWDMDGDDE